MKIRSLAILAMAGFLAASFSYIAPAFADDTSMSDGSGTGSQDPSSMGSATDNAGSAAGQTQDSSSGTTDAGSTSLGSNDGSPDTATGDDDY